MANILITGASSGIGLELTKQLTKAGHQVFAVCRKSQHDLEQTGAKVISGIDLTNPSSFLKVKTALGENSLDILWNNAGLLEKESLQNLNIETIEAQWKINALAPLQLTHALLSHLKNGSKIVITSTRMGSIADNTSGAYYGYRMSKAAVNMMGKSLAMDLKPQGITVLLLHPGYVQTKMTGFQGDLTAEQSASRMIELVLKKGINETGTFWHSNGEQLPW